jgi:DNA polymerase III subunit delta'
MIDDAPDIAFGTIHPRENYSFFTNEKAEESLLAALNGARMHHAWIFNGPRGIGKATLAYRLARRYLGAKPTGESPLAVSQNDIICQQIQSNSYPDLRVATRYCPKDEKVKSVISVEAIRNLTSMFDLRANNAMGRRVAIIDAADEMNEASANALLKTLEEPPNGALLILITNSIGRILPTIRSRCRLLTLEPETPEKLRLILPQIDDATLIMAGGCVGRAKVLQQFEISNIYKIISRTLGTLPNCSLENIIATSKLATDIQSFEIIISVIENWLNRAAKASVGVTINEIEPGESANMARIFGGKNLDKIYTSWQSIIQLKRQVGNNLDRSAAIIDIITRLRADLIK